MALNKGDESASGVKYIITSLVEGSGCYYSGNASQLEKLDPKKFILRASDYGGPLHRGRVIFLGIKENLFQNLSLDDVLRNIQLPGDLQKNVSVGTAISDLQPQFSKLSSSSTDVQRRKSVPASSLSKRKLYHKMVGVVSNLIDGWQWRYSMDSVAKNYSGYFFL